MLHTEAQASGPSARFVQAFWQSTGVYAAGSSHRVLPDATAVEAVLGQRGPMALTRQAAAGVRLGRAAIRALDPKRPTLLRVILGRR